MIATDRVVLVARYDHPLLAFSTSCGSHGSPCDPLWRTAHGVTGVTLTGNRIYAAESFKAKHAWRAGLAAFPLDCAPHHAICRPMWVGSVGPISPNASRQQWWLGTPNRFTTPIVQGGVVYTSGSVDAGLTHPGEVFGPLYAFDAFCSIQSQCDPLWRTEGLNGVGTPAVRDNSVFVPSTSGLYTFGEGCRSDGGTCPPLWHAPTNIAGNLSNVLNQPVVSGRHVFVTTEGDTGGGDSEPSSIFAYPLGCRADGGVCAPTWWARIHPTDRFTSRPIVHGDSVLVAGRNGLIEYPTGCRPDGGRCKNVGTLSDGRSDYTPSWPAPVLRGRTIVAGTVTRDSGRESGFDTFRIPCEHSVCRPFSSWHPRYRVRRIIAVASDEVFAATAGGVVAISISNGQHRRPRVDWRWSTPDGHNIEQIVPSGCTTYVITARSLFSVDRC